MEPISTSYYPSTLRGPDGLYRPRESREGTGRTTDERFARETGTRQEGFRPAEQGEAEFRPYGPDGRQERRDQSEATSPGEGDRRDTANQTDVGTTVSAGQGTGQLSLQDQQVVARLKATEDKVKAHEAAHKAAGGAATGPVSYTYTRGPDGKNYVTGGEVPITISTGRTPQETITRMQQVIDAALAPSDPSPQDRAVAAQAAAMQQAARQEQASAGTDATEGDQSVQEGGTAGNPRNSTNGLSGDEANPIQAEQAGVPASKGQPLAPSADIRRSQQAYSDPVVSGAGAHQRKPADSAAAGRQSAESASAHMPGRFVPPDKNSSTGASPLLSLMA